MANLVVTEKGDDFITNCKRLVVYLPNEQAAEMQRYMAEEGIPHQSEFMRRAVDFYISFFRSKKCLDILSPLLAGAIKGEVESLEHNVSEMLFKLAVEQSVTNGVLAMAYDIALEDVENFRKYCAQSVAEINGILDLESACEFQNFNSNEFGDNSLFDDYTDEGGVM